MDTDEDLEMIWDDNTASGIYVGYNHDGTPMGGDWPLQTQPDHTTHFTNPFVMDVDNNGFLDISGACQEPEYGMYSFYLWNTDVPFDSSKAILPVLQYNVRHTGVYGTSLITNLRDEKSEITTRVFPIPSSDLIKCKFKNAGKKEISLVSFHGKTVYSNKTILTEGESLKIDVSGMASGVYFLRIREDIKITCHKIIVNK